MDDENDVKTLSMRLDGLDVALALVGMYGLVALILWVGITEIPAKLGLLGALGGPGLRRAVGIPVRPAPTTEKALARLASLGTLLGVVMVLVGGLMVGNVLRDVPDFEAKVAQERAGMPVLSFGPDGETAEARAAREAAEKEERAASIKREAARRVASLEDERKSDATRFLPVLVLGILMLGGAEKLTRIRLKREGVA